MGSHRPQYSLEAACPSISKPLEAKSHVIFQLEIEPTCSKLIRCTGNSAVSGGTPIISICPLVPVASKPALITPIFPVVSITTVAPLPPVIPFTTSTKSTPETEVLMVWVAPKLFASSSRESKRSTPIMVRQPLILAACVQDILASRPLFTWKCRV